jgi:hypothetical protein
MTLLPLLALTACFQPETAPAVPEANVESAAPANPLCADPFVAALDEGARRWATGDLTTSDYGTGAALFDEEWLFGTWMMAAVGLGQRAALCPASADADLAAMELALDRMVSPAGRAFDTRSYGVDIGERLGEDRGSAALLGYGGLPLALHRALVPDTRFAATEAAWIDALARRMAGGLVETYPGQRFPVDNAAGVAALALHDRATGEDHGAALAAGLAGIAAARDAASGLLVQRVDADGTPLDAPRGSGTFLAAWFLHRADPDLARGLYDAGRDQLYGSVLGLSAMREYPAGREGRGDIDSGPLILGYSVSSTGFALGGAAAFDDLTTRDALLATARLGGPFAVGVVPGLAADEEGGATGSHLGDAILLAMLTAQGRP